MTVGQLFCASFAISALLFVSFFLFLDPRPAMRAFKLAGTRSAADGILRQWQSPGLTIARRNLTVDWFFIVVYSTMWISGALYLGPRVDPRLHVPAMLFAAIGIAGALFDVVENLCLYRMLHGNTSESAPRLCRRVMPLNIGLFGVTMLYFIIAAASWWSGGRL